MGEIECARMVNKKCVELGLPLKNPSVGLKKGDEPIKRSIYSGVYWRKKNNKWSGYICHNHKRVYVGSSVDEHNVAVFVNQACIKFGIPVKNPGVAITNVEKIGVRK